MDYIRKITIYLNDGTSKVVNVSPITIMEAIKIEKAQEEAREGNGQSDAVIIAQTEMMRKKAGLTAEEMDKLVPYSFFNYLETLNQVNEAFSKMIEKKGEELKNEEAEEVKDLGSAVI